MSYSGSAGATPLPSMLPPDGGITSAPDASQALIRAVSRYWAIQAAKITRFDGIEGVKPFRFHELGGQVLGPEQIDKWIAERQREDGEPSLWLSGVALNRADYKLQDDGTLTLTKSILISRTSAKPNTAFERPSLSSRSLTYLIPKRPIGKAMVSVTDGGVLDRLRRLSLALAADFNWLPEQAATLALTGMVPLIPADYARQLADVRVNGRRPREMSIKHLELALFTEEHEGATMAVRMAEWNAAFPQWEYSAPTNFGWDSREAVRRLTERMGGAPSHVLPSASATPSPESGDLTPDEVAQLLAEHEAFEREEQEEVARITTDLRNAQRELAGAKTNKERQRASAWISELLVQLERASPESPAERAEREARDARQNKLA